ncbi:MAG: glycosyltransferase family 4 protein [Cyanobacteria bacterium P01_E01_bin.6]
MPTYSWICCQIGAREHYSIPRALHQAGQLQYLITDAWVPPRSPIHHLPGSVSQSLAERYHTDLKTAHVQSFTASLIPFELRQTVSQTTGWSRILARNQWFQHHALISLKALSAKLKPGDRPILFSYSYAALELFRYAKQQGWCNVLGQIDPGIVEEQQVATLHACYGSHYQSSWTPAPELYWQKWQQECELADHIIVNSTWSETALVQASIPKKKIAIAPLAHQAPIEATTFSRTYPTQFTSVRPLRVLFLGQIILRKGIAALMESLPYLHQNPVEIWLVGPSDLTLPSALMKHPQLKWVERVPRSHVQNYYQQADVFLLPTHSDGFGLTQLEAQTWKLPVIASRHCGAVVNHQQNGLILPEISGKAIADALLSCCRHPEYLQYWANQIHSRHAMSCYSLNQLACTLQNLVNASA